jgi:hypothetical protein
MTALAPHITAFLRQRLPMERAASPHTCDTYAYAFRLLFEFASRNLGVPPSALNPVGDLNPCNPEGLEVVVVFCGVHPSDRRFIDLDDPKRVSAACESPGPFAAAGMVFSGKSARRWLPKDTRI